MRTLTLAVFCVAAALALAGCRGGGGDDHAGHDMTSPAVQPR